MKACEGIRRCLVAYHPLGRTQSHGSSLLVLPDGSLLVAWFAGSHEGAPDTRIMTAHGTVSAFSAPRIVADAECPHWNPVLSSGPDGRIWLFFRRGPSIETWTTWVCHSNDGGQTWDDPAELVPGSHSRGPVRQSPLWCGPWWVAPGSTEVWSPEPRWDCSVDLTRDGMEWTPIAIPLDHAAVRGAGAIQPALAPGRSTQLVALARSSGGRVLRSATDDPRVWPALEPCGLPNNNSGLAATTLPDGTIVCAHNPGDTDWGARCPLSLSASRDDGQTWRWIADLDDGRAPVDGLLAPALGAETSRSAGSPAGAFATGVVTSGDGEFSYPSMALTHDKILVTYTWQRRGIVLAEVPCSAFNT